MTYYFENRLTMYKTTYVTSDVKTHRFYEFINPLSRYTTFNPMPGRLFRTFERQEGLFDLRQKNYKRCLLHSNHLNLGTIHLWTLTTFLTLAT